MFPFGGLLGGLNFTLQLSNQSITDDSVASGTAVAEFGLESDGDAYTLRTVSDSGIKNFIVDEWMKEEAKGEFDPADYEFRHTTFSISLGTGATNQFVGTGPAAPNWNSFASFGAPIWRLIQPMPTSGIQSSTWVIDIEVREVADPSNIVTARISLQSIADNS